MADRIGRGLQIVTIASNHHRSGGQLLATPETSFIAQRQMHAGGLDTVDQLDRSGELTFERPYTGDLLHEGGQAQ